MAAQEKPAKNESDGNSSAAEAEVDEEIDALEI